MSLRKSRSWVLGYLSLGFALMIVLTWVAEFTDLSYRIFGGERHINDWRDATIQTIFILLVWGVSFLSIRRLAAHLYRLEGFLRVCAWCRKVGYQDKWLPLEQYFAQGFQVETTHGMCPECFKKAQEDTDRFLKIGNKVVLETPTNGPVPAQATPPAA